MFNDIIDFIKDIYRKEKVPLHEPQFFKNEKSYVNECINSTFVSSVGLYVDKFEKMICEFTGAKYAIATVNGTAALHVALILSNINSGDEIITQPLSFVATSNAIRYINANPIFLDVDRDTLGLSAEKLSSFLSQNAKIDSSGSCINIKTGRKIAACVPMHTFGHPCRIDEIKKVCDRFNITLIEDAAESLGSYYNEKHTGTFGLFGTLSFNGNKIITTGGGGMLITNDENLARKAKHITTTAKLAHSWEYIHDMVGYNYRLPNINAALGCAQMENLEEFLFGKRKIAELYSNFFKSKEFNFITEPDNSTSNYWLNGVLLKDIKERDEFLKYTNENGVMTRPIWKLLNELDMFKDFQTEDLSNSKWLAERVVNLPSSYIQHK